MLSIFYEDPKWLGKPLHETGHCALYQIGRSSLVIHWLEREDLELLYKIGSRVGDLEFRTWDGEQEWRWRFDVVWQEMHHDDWHSYRPGIVLGKPKLNRI